MKTKVTFQNRLYQEKNPGTLLIFPTLYLLSESSGIFFNDVRANIKIKKEKKLNSKALLGLGAAEVEQRKRGEKEGD